MVQRWSIRRSQRSIALQHVQLEKECQLQKEHLVDTFFDHVKDPVNHEILDFLHFLVEFAHEFHAEHHKYPDADAIATTMNNGKKGEPEEQGATIIADLVDLFSGKRPEELKAKQFRALRERWGFWNHHQGSASR